jgi:hypothetical protein
MWDLRQRTDPLRYQLNNESTHHCDRCFGPLVPDRAQYKASEITDIESKLMTLNIPNTGCPPNLNKNLCLTNEKTKKFEECDWYHSYNESSRFTHPIENYRELGVGVERIINLGIEPTIRHYGCYGKNTHLEAIDRHRPCLPKPISMKPVLPQ